MSNELYPLMRFLMEKGAFWTGVTRGINFGGKVSNLGNMLWFDFFNNPLYLGTIAFSEGIQRINFSIIFYEKCVSIQDRNFERIVAKDTDGEDLEGGYVTIALTPKDYKPGKKYSRLRGQVPANYRGKKQIYPAG